MRMKKKREQARLDAPQAVASTCAAIALLLSANVLIFASAAVAQTAGPSAPSSAPASPAPLSPSQSQTGGGALGAWVRQGGTWMQQSSELVEQSVASMGAGFGQMVGAIGGQANQATKDAADAARNAAASVSRLPNTGLTTGNERCAIAPNGAPDCRVAAETLCRAQGYTGGASVDFITVENCPPPWRSSRREAPAGVCTMEHYVTKALCQ